jgi:mono/diheme cytochrome c family protein
MAFERATARAALAVSLLLLIVVLAVAQAPVAAGTPSESDTTAVAAQPGQVVFIEQNCSLCHTAYARGVGEPPAGSTTDGGAPTEKSAEPVMAGGPPDLSTLADWWTPDLLKAYLVDREPLEGQKHVTSFRGSEEDWQALSEWMLPSARSDSTLSPVETNDAGAADASGGTDAPAVSPED